MFKHALLALALLSCATNPVTKKPQLALITEEQEVELGQESSQEIARTVGVYEDKKALPMVERIGNQLARESERPGLPWTFQILDDPAVNAFALPGGPVYVTRGMLARMSSEAELASVLGHEVGHVTARHSVNQLSKQELAQLGLTVGAAVSETVAGVAGALGAGASLLFLKFSRDAEREADELGLRYASEAGWDGRQMLSMFHTLQRVGESQSGGRLPGWLSTHPDPEDRLASTERLLAEHPEAARGRVARDEYLMAIDGLPFGANPREGYFDGNEFIHPGLGVSFRFPPGWEASNLPTAAAAVSPDKDGVVELRVVPDQPDKALEKFASQQGVRIARPEGIAPNTALFSGGTEQGPVDGIVTFRERGGRTFMMLGYASRGRLEKHADAFKGSFTSLSPIVDPEILQMQPSRVKIVRVDKPMALDEFNRAFPSNASLEDVAEVNGIDKGGTIPAGLAKTIVGGPKRSAPQARRETSESGS